MAFEASLIIVEILYANLETKWMSGFKRIVLFLSTGLFDHLCMKQRNGRKFTMKHLDLNAHSIFQEEISNQIKEKQLKMLPKLTKKHRH